MGVPIHFTSSTISGSALWMIARTFASVLPRQAANALILASMKAEAESAGTGDFMFRSKPRNQFSCGQRYLQPAVRPSQATRPCDAVSLALVHGLERIAVRIKHISGVVARIIFQSRPR